MSPAPINLDGQSAWPRADGKPSAEEVTEFSKKLNLLFSKRLGKGEEHTVAKGETLQSILSTGYPDILSTPTPDQARWLVGLMVHLNPALMTNPGLLREGQKIVLPSGAQVLDLIARAEGQTPLQREFLERLMRRAAGEMVVKEATENLGTEQAKQIERQVQLDGPLTASNAHYDKYKGDLRKPSTANVLKPPAKDR